MAKKHKFKPKKFLGQIFLKEKPIADLIAKSLEVESSDIILEIGPGKGILTESVFSYKPKKIIAIEKDIELKNFLEEKFSNNNLETIFKDIRKINLESFFKKNRITKIVSNLPYYLSGYFLRQILNLGKYPKIIILMLQKEVSQKILARESNFFSVSFGLFFKKEKIRTIKPGSFYPKPNVYSEIVKFSSKKLPIINQDKKQSFFEFLNLAFRQNKKILFSNLKTKYQGDTLEDIFNKLKIERKIRPHQLETEILVEVFKRLEK